MERHLAFSIYSKTASMIGSSVHVFNTLCLFFRPCCTARRTDPSVSSPSTDLYPLSLVEPPSFTYNAFTLISDEGPD